MPKELADYAAEFDWCAVCWSRYRLETHHMVQGTGRTHERVGLVRLCQRCHWSLHSGGNFKVTKGMVLAAKREQDPDYFDPAALAAMKHRQSLPYGPEPISSQIHFARMANGVPNIAMINSRSKGARGEREGAHAINLALPHANAYRGQQRSGTETSSDVVTPGMPDLWVEVKRTQRLNIHAVMGKAVEQCGSLTPVVLHRKNGEEWLLTVRLDDVGILARNVLNVRSVSKN